MPDDGERPLVAPVITHVTDDMLLFGSEKVTASPPVSSTWHEVGGALTVIGRRHEITGGALFRVTVTSLLVSDILFISGSSPETEALLLKLPLFTSSTVIV